MPEWDMVAALTGIALIPFVLQPHWWALAKQVQRRVDLHFHPERNRCQKLCWGDMPSQLHRCPYGGPFSFHRCVNPKDPFCEVFNTQTGLEWVNKPEGLPLDSTYTFTDRNTLLAFIFLTCPVSWSQGRSDIGHDSIHLDSTKVTFRRDSDSGVIVIHVEGRLEHKGRLYQLTKHEVECLIQGYPPFYREWIDCGKFTIPSPIRAPDDKFRGGWIIGIGLGDQKAAPTAIYMAVDDVFADQGVFRRSLRRVLEILEKAILVNFPEDLDVQQTVKAVKYMINSWTNSGGRSYVRDSMLRPNPDEKGLSRQQCVRAMEIFNGSPVPSEEDLARIQADCSVHPMLPRLMAATFLGVEECLSYIKNGGRVLNLPRLMREEDSFYLQVRT